MDKEKLFKKGLELSMAVLLLAGVWFLSRQGAMMVMNRSADRAQEKMVVVIDSGHGGNDPGKIGINGALEKDINLKVAKKLKLFLEAEDIEVVMLREDDQGLYDENSPNKKAQDMKNRCALIEKADPVITVSIHQNSYHEEYVKGAQVFYYSQSGDGQKAAEILQQQLISSIDPENKRAAKANDSYYLLKNTTRPTIIVDANSIIGTNQRITCRYKGFRDLSLFHFCRFSIPGQAM